MLVRNVAAVGAAVALVTALLTPVAAEAATRDGGGSQELPTVEGTIYNSSGDPVSAGWAVQLIAEPGPAIVEALQVGDSVPEQQVATATTDDSGHFALSVTNPASITQDALPNGTVNFTVRSFAEGDLHEFAVPVTIANPVAATAHAALGARVVLGRTVAKNRKPVRGVKVRALPGSSARIRTLVDAEPDVNPGCGPATVVGTYAGRHVQVGEAYTSSGSKATFTYKVGSNSHLEVGVSAGGAWTASGTADVSSDTAQGFGPLSGNDGIKWTTAFTYVKTQQTCTGAGTHYRLYAKKFDSGDYSIDSKPFAVNRSYCRQQKAGDHLTKTSSNAYNFGTGADVSSIIGIDLKARTGWDTETSLRFDFTKTMDLCGKNDVPGGSPVRLYATP